MSKPRTLHDRLAAHELLHLGSGVQARMAYADADSQRTASPGRPGSQHQADPGVSGAVEGSQGFLERFHPAWHAEAMQSIAMLYVILPYPPAANNLYATVRGRRVKSERGRQYETACALAVRDAVEPTEPLPQPPFCVVIHLWVPDERRRDLDGAVKAPIDNVFRALKSAVYQIDDSMIQELHVHKAVDRKRPRLEMMLSQHRPKS